jgi:hypothetical protein
MATFCPPATHFDELFHPLDPGEVDVAERLARLDDDWTVYVHPQLGQDVPDFLLVHDTQGVVVVDVVRRPDQSDATARRHRTTIVDQFFSLPGDSRDPGPTVRIALVTPSVISEDATDDGPVGHDLMELVLAPPDISWWSTASPTEWSRRSSSAATPEWSPPTRRVRQSEG